MERDVRVVFNCVGVEFGLMTHGMHSQKMDNLNKISTCMSFQPKYSPAPKRNQDAIPRYLSSVLSSATVKSSRVSGQAPRIIRLGGVVPIERVLRISPHFRREFFCLIAPQ